MRKAYGYSTQSKVREKPVLTLAHFIGALLGGLITAVIFCDQLSAFSPGFVFTLVIVSITPPCVVMWLKSMAFNTSAISKSYRIGVCVLVVYFILGLIISSGMVQTEAHRTLIGESIDSAGTTGLPSLDKKVIPFVSQEMALQMAKKKLAENPALGSMVELRTLQKQSVNGKLYWVGFLEFRGFFAWNKLDSIPGYLKVSASNPNDIEFVHTVNGSPVKIKYLESAYFLDDAMRKMYFKGNMTNGLTYPTYEIDDAGRPYLVGTVYNRKIGFGGADAIGVSVLDVQTGEVINYSVKDAPKWIDLIQDPSQVRSQLENHLDYVNGFFNFSAQGKMALSGSLDLIYGADHTAYYITGITSQGKDESISGFILVNSRNKAVSKFNLPQGGVTESIAKKVVQNVLPEKHYVASEPIPFMYAGTPVYIMTLHDDLGVARAFGVVNILNYQVVSVADTAENALRSFEMQLSDQKTSMEKTSDTAVARAVSGTVLRIGAEIRGSATVYFLILKDNPHVFMVKSSVSDLLAVTKENDAVSISVTDADQKTVIGSKFTNESLKDQNTAP